MRRTLSTVFFWCLLSAQSMRAEVVVSNVRAAQIEGTLTVQIMYDLACDDEVSVSLSAMDGTTPVTCRSITGAIGNNVSAGTDRTMVWDVGADWPNQTSTSMILSVTASNAPPGGDPTAISWQVVNDRWVRNQYADDAITMSDRNSGLMWVYDADENGSVAWTAANTKCLNLVYAGHGDWFLPGKSELTAIYPQKAFFKDVETDWYWSTTLERPGYRYIVHMNDNASAGGNVNYPYWVWPCRTVANGRGAPSSSSSSPEIRVHSWEAALGDFDNDGAQDAFQDFDGDGTPDAFTDYDGDGTPDAFTDYDGDGTPDAFGTDENANGKPDVFEFGWLNGVFTDYDGDGKPDAFEDYDGDGTPDAFTDFDGDGTPDCFENSDHDSVADGFQTRDGSSTPAAFEDADGDGLRDWWSDLDANNTPDGFDDADGDGIFNLVDTGSAVLLVPELVTADEGQSGSDLIQAELRGSNAAGVTLTYVVQAELQGDEFEGVSGTAEWLAGESGAKEFAVPGLAGDDAVYYGDRSFALLLSAPAGVLLERSETQIVVRDNDLPPRLVVADAVVSEGDGTALVPVALAGVWQCAVSMAYEVKSGTASETEDYLPQSGVLTWAVGETTARHIAVELAEDDLPERPETFSIVFSEPLNVRLGGATVEITIRDDDPIHVRWDADGMSDGSSWQNAFTDLQDGLSAARSGGSEIWVADGTYTPTDGTDRSASFEMAEGVHVYGGFAGFETERGQRDLTVGSTVLSGDIGRAGVLSDNSYHVVTGADGSLLDGFTVTLGVANGSAFSGESDKGGGMLNRDVSPIVRNCVFDRNSATRGGGIYNLRGSPQIQNVTFSRNTAQQDGGGMDSFDGAPILHNCVFIDNRAMLLGGAVENTYGMPTFVNCTFARNRAEAGGAIASEDSFPSVTNCILWGNLATFEPATQQRGDREDPRVGSHQIYDGPGAFTTVSFSCIDQDGYAATQDAYGYVNNGNLRENPTFLPGSLGNVSLAQGSPCIDAADGAMALTQDRDGRFRYDAPTIPDAGSGSPSYADMGAVEWLGDAEWNRVQPLDGQFDGSDSIVVPLVLELGDGERVTSLQFRVSAEALWPAAAVLHPIEFSPATDLPTPDYVELEGNSLLIGWLGDISPAIAGSSTELGTIRAPLRQTPSEGSRYAITVSAASATDQGIPVPLQSGGTIVSVGLSWKLVGDVSPVGVDDSGDGDLTNADVRMLFYWSLGGTAPGAGGADVPTAGTRLHDVADAFPLDVPPLAGGDGRIDNADVLTTLRRSLLTSSASPWVERAEKTDGQRVARHRTTVPTGSRTRSSDCVIYSGMLYGSAGTSVRVPVMAEISGEGVSSIQFRCELTQDGGGSKRSPLPVSFTPAEGVPEPDLAYTDSATGVLMLAWLRDMPSPLTGTMELGHLEFAVPSDTAAGTSLAVRFARVSATNRGTEQTASAGAAGGYTVVGPGTGWWARLVLQDEGGTLDEVRFGMMPGASASYDPGMDLAEHSVDAVALVSARRGSALKQDFRSGAEEQDWLLAVRPGKAGRKLTWPDAPLMLPDGRHLTLVPVSSDGDIIPHRPAINMTLAQETVVKDTEEALFVLRFAPDVTAVVTLEAGWNQISLPVELADGLPAIDREIARRMGRAVTPLVGWVWSNLRYTQTQNPGPLEGCWVWSALSATVSLRGKCPEPGDGLPSAKAWSLMGTAVEQVPQRGTSAYWWWDPLKREYVNPECLLPSRGYWYYPAK